MVPGHQHSAIYRCLPQLPHCREDISQPPSPSSAGLDNGSSRIGGQGQRNGGQSVSSPSFSAFWGVLGRHHTTFLAPLTMQSFFDGQATDNTRFGGLSVEPPETSCPPFRLQPSSQGPGLGGWLSCAFSPLYVRASHILSLTPGPLSYSSPCP